MISLSSSQAGIVAARRNKLNQTQFNNYRHVKVEYNDPYFFENSPPKGKHKFTARHIYKYDKPSNSFYFLGVQKAQSLKRIGTWVNQIIIAGFTDTNINGTYIRTLPGQIFYKDANHYITADRILIENGNTVGEVVIDINDPANSFLNNFDSELYPYDGTPPNPNVLYDNLNTDNTTLNNINNNRLYTDTNPDYSRAQLLPNLNFNIDTANIFDKKNLPHNQKVFIDVRWVKFKDGARVNDDNWWQDSIGGCYMNENKGNIYRVGIIIKDNTIDSMLYYNDLVANNAIIFRMQKSNAFYGII